MWSNSVKSKIIMLFLSLTIVLSIITIGVLSITAHAICCRKDYFDKSRYTLTGDMAHDVAVIAKSQKGRTCDDFGYSGVDYGGWCDEFCADCIENAGADSSIVAHGGTVADFESKMRERGAVTVSSPQEGDLIFFSNMDHVEIVTKVENGQVYCAGGNNGNYPGQCNGERSISGWGTPRLYLRPNYNKVTPHKLTINYYSNYADKSFSNPLNAVGSSKSVLVKKLVINPANANDSLPDGLHNYTTSGSSCYLGRTGYTGTGDWNTSKDGNGISVNQDTAFSNAIELASALGKDLSSEDVTINLYPKWSINKLTINYYSNYADKSFDNPLNAIGSNKNVIVKKSVLNYDISLSPNGLYNYKSKTSACYLGRTGFTAVGNWNTKSDGSGISINQDTAFSSTQAFAAAVGKDLSNGSVVVNLYPEWTRHKLTVNYYSNYADESFDNPLNQVSSNGSYWVKTKNYYYGRQYSDGLFNYTDESDEAYLGRTYYTGTGNWNTAKDGSGYSVNQDTEFSGQALAQALGVDITDGDVKVSVYPQWRANKLTINYYSNKADKSFTNPLNAVGADKNVIVRKVTAVHGAYSSYIVRDYSKDTDDTYLGRTGYTATGYWNTKTAGSGYGISEKDYYSSVQEFAQAVGKDISKGDATVNLYPQWRANRLIVYYCSNYADKSFNNPQNAIGSDKNVVVRSKTYYYGTSYSGGLCDYSDSADDTYLGRTYYTATCYWNTKSDGSGYSVHEDTGFDSGREFAQALGKDISNEDASVYVYAQWTANKLTINIYSNYADKSFANPLNAVGPDKNVKVRTTSAIYGAYATYVVPDYTKESDTTYLGRTGYTATGFWNTKANGSGYSIDEKATFSSAQELAQAYGKDLSNGNASVSIYPQWRSGIDAPATSINKSRAETGETITFTYTPITGATVSNYRIECKKSDDTSVISVNNSSGSYQFSLNEPGEYSITAVAVTPEGIESNSNNWQHFTVYTTYTVTLNPNYDTAEATSTVVESDTGTALPDLTRNNYSLVGWNTQADGEGTNYSVGSIFKPMNKTTLYAVWLKNPCEHTETYSALENIVDATCTSDGSHDLVTYCSNCGEEIDRIAETDEMLGHSFTNYVYDENATTEADGTETAVCDRCDETDVRTKPGSKIHTHSYSGETISPSCTEQGYTIYSCDCGDSYIDDYVQEKGHSFSNYKYNNDATTENDGTETAKCDCCDATDTRTKPGTKLSINPTANAKINVAGAKEVRYKTKVTITATATNLSSDYHLVMIINNEMIEGNNKQVSYEYGPLNEDLNYTVMIVDSKGVVQKDVNGNKLIKDGGKITCVSNAFIRFIMRILEIFRLLPSAKIKP